MNPLPRNLRAPELALRVRRRVLDLSYQARVGHIGSCLSVVDLLAAVYASDWFAGTPTGSPNRDRFVLGKGHAGLALFATLECMGVVRVADLDTFGSDGSLFGVHPEIHVNGIDFSTGSLGQGLGMAVGSALASRIQTSERNVVALLSDAECNAGATWEAANFAGQHRLANLVTIIDVNGQQALGRTNTILDQEPFGERWQAAGWEVREVDGHDHEEIGKAITPSPVGPVAVVARTVFGAGVSFMEGRLDWHYLPMNDDQYELATNELEAPDAE